MTTSASSLSAAATTARSGNDSLPVKESERTLPSRAYYSASIESFLATDADTILAALVKRSEFEILPTQRDAWLEQIEILRTELRGRRGRLYLEYSIPRIGKRIDAIVLTGSVVFVLEFKVGENEFSSHAADQVCDYALDLKDFYEPCRSVAVVPVLIATKADVPDDAFTALSQRDFFACPLHSNGETLRRFVDEVLRVTEGKDIEIAEWDTGRYCPTPTIVEAARALYAGHSVEDISRNDAEAKNIGVSSHLVSKIISTSRDNQQKSICFVTGVPGAGKTLVGLDIANEHFDPASELYSVFLSGNGPLVKILREALARDTILRDKQRGVKTTKSSAERRVKAFIQNVHNFRDECLVDRESPPLEHVALFDEAQRAWNLEQTAKFMRQKKGIAGFEKSEPEFLIECFDRHRDWAVVVCLVGGGQEINTGEAGIGEWITALNQSFPKWHVYVSPRLTDTEYGAGRVLEDLRTRPNVTYRDELHLSVSMRSFRSEKVSLLVKQLLDQDFGEAKTTWAQARTSYPIVVMVT